MGHYAGNFEERETNGGRGEKETAGIRDLRARRTFP